MHLCLYIIYVFCFILCVPQFVNCDIRVEGIHARTDVSIYLFLFNFLYPSVCKLRHSHLSPNRPCLQYACMNILCIYASIYDFFFFFYLSCTHTHKSRAQSEKHCRRRGASSGQKTRGCIEGEKPSQILHNIQLTPTPHPQFVNCDIRTFPMPSLGKFAVIMADPPWDIHMELPYGTMSDDEMRKMDVQVHRIITM